MTPQRESAHFNFAKPVCIKKFHQRHAATRPNMGALTRPALTRRSTSRCVNVCTEVKAGSKITLMVATIQGIFSWLTRQKSFENQLNNCERSVILKGKEEITSQESLFIVVEVCSHRAAGLQRILLNVRRFSITNEVDRKWFSVT